jgi:hypothetical protein
MASLQRLLQDEERHPWLLVAQRGERASWHVLFSDMESGKARMKAVGGTIWPAQTPAPLAGMIEFLATPRCKVVHAARLRYLNESIEIAKLSLADQEQSVDRGTSAQPMAATYYGNKWTPTPLRNLERVKEHQSLIRCGIVLLALERYRKAHGRWPGSLADLVPVQLPAVPLDPFDGAPLRYGTHPAGVVISSLKQKGFRLWGPDGRRQRAGAQTEPGTHAGK